jgi:D-3-phosphoglycerate dehydrogenase
MSNLDQKTVVITDYDYDDVEIERQIVEAAGFRLVAAQSKIEDEVIDIARDAAAVIAQYAPISARVINALTRCQIIARYGTGVDVIDVEAASRRHILVTNVPNDWCEGEVADHAIALMLQVARKIGAYDRATRSGVWRWQTGRPIPRLQGQTLGLLSFGAIAQAIARRATGFGMRVIAHDPYMAPASLKEHGAMPVSFDDLVGQSDVLVIQAPLTRETHGLFGESVLRRMKPTSILVNTARGPIVNDRALFRALSEGWIMGAGVDDIEEEPSKVANWKPTNPLFSLENIVITPHAAYYSEESVGTLRDFVAREVVRVLTGMTPLSPVNAWQLATAGAGS